MSPFRGLIFGLLRTSLKWRLLDRNSAKTNPRIDGKGVSDGKGPLNTVLHEIFHSCKYKYIACSTTVNICFPQSILPTLKLFRLLLVAGYKFFFELSEVSFQNGFAQFLYQMDNKVNIMNGSQNAR